ncbi:MAG: DNA alkylation repair protein [Candidatus Pacebacteria bacterium]|nr:DNA alkylation repair protein [Candidatus Paceibacterota bacterium]
MSETGISGNFGSNLAQMLGKKILAVYPDFAYADFVSSVKKQVQDKMYTERVNILADALQKYLPKEYPKALQILMNILGEENQNETGMFKEYYWILPIGKFVEKYGIDDFAISMKALEEITKRNTGEYAIRPFIRKYPKRSLAIMKKWAKSKNFHLRRLASEGLRPKLPWASKLDIFIENPEPVFEILEILKEDPIKFVQKSVANHVRDYIKVNSKATEKLVKGWQKTNNPYTLWIIKHAQRGK